MSFDFRSGNLGDFVKDFKELNQAQQIAAINSGQFTKEQQKLMMRSAGLTMTQSGQVVATEAVAGAQAGATTTTTGLSAATKGLMATLKPFVPLMITAIGLFAAWKAFKWADDKFTLTFKTAQKHLEDSTAAYSDTVSELESLKSQTDEYKSTLESIGSKYDIEFTGSETVDEMIDKLQSIDGGVDIADEASIKKLERKNELLKTQESILSSRATIQQKQAAEDARTSINFKSEDIFITDGQGNLVANSGGGLQKITVDRKQYVQEQIKEMERAQAEIEEAQAKIASGDTSEKWAKQFENATADLEEYKNNASSILSELNAEAENFYDAETGLVLSGFEEDAKAIESLNDAFNNFDLSPAEKKLKSVDDYFKDTSKNTLKEKLLEVAKSKKSTDAVSKALQSMGINLESAGLDADTLNEYFNEMADAANEAASATAKVNNNLTMSDVGGAFETANDGDNYVAFADYLKKAKELYDQGLVGTDEFKAVAEMMSYNIDSTTASFEAGYKKFKNYFKEDSDGNLTGQGIHNFLTDLQALNKGYATFNKETGKWDLTMENTAQAAKDMGMGVGLFEALLGRIKDYDNVGDFNFTSAITEFNEAKVALEQLKQTYDELEDGDDKTSLGEKLEKWSPLIEQAEDDLASLPKEVITQLKFEYDKSELKKMADDALSKSQSSGWKNVDTNATAMVTATNYKDELLSAIDISSIDSAILPVYFDAENAISNLTAQLESGNLSEEQVLEIQPVITNLTNLQTQIIEAFQNAHPEITPETDPSVANATFQEWVNSVEGQEVVAQATIENKDAISKIEELIDSNYGSVEINADLVDNASDKLNEIEGYKFSQKVAELTAEDDATPYLRLWNDLNMNPKFALMTAEDQATEVVNFWNALEPETKEAYMNGEISILDTSTPTIQGVGSQLASLPSLTQVQIDADSNVPGQVSNANLLLSGLDGKTVHTYIVTHKSTTNDLGGTAHLSGTAYAHGTIGDSSWLKSNWKTKKSEAALVGEEGQELVATRDDGWYTVGDNGAEFTYIPSGSVVFDARQTKELLSKGKINGRGRNYLSGTNYLGSANGSFNFGGGASKYNTSSKSSSKSSSSSNSSSNSSSASDSADEFRETLDEIEILLDELERDISNLDTIAQGSYRNWSERNQALGQEMSKVTELINVQQQAYNKYMEKANSIGLSADWVDKILNGKLAIEDITDEDLHDKIKEFEDWSSKAKECSDAILELQDDLADLASQKFENTKQEYEDLLSTIEHRIDMIDGSIDKIETQGYLVSAKMYEQMAKSQQDSISMLEQEYSALQTELSNSMASGDIKKFSEEWYSLVGEIQDVEKELQDVNTELIETKNNMRELEWEIFDRGQDMISELHAESEFLRDLMSNEKMFNTDDASITEHGQATLGLHAVSYNAYMSQAQDYAKEIQKINAELANDPYNTILLDKRSELLESQREMIENAEDEKAAIKDLVEEGYDTFLDVMDKLIEKRMDMFDNVSDLYDFQKEITDFNKEIASLEKQAMALRGDDSETAKASIQQIKIDLEEARQNRDEAMYDKYRSDTEKMLNLMMDETELWINERLDNEALLLQGVIDSTNLNASEIRDTLVSETEKVGTTLSSYMQSIWGDGGTFTAIVSTYNNGFTTQLTTTNSTLASIKELLSKMIEDSNKKTEAEISKTDKNASQTVTSQPAPAPVAPQKTEQKKPTSSGDGTPRVGDKVTFASGNYFLDSEGTAPTGNKNRGGQVYITSINNASWAKKPYHISTGSKLGNGDLGWVTLDQLTGYSTGGFIKDTGLFVGHGSPNNPEIVLKPYDSENFVELRDTLREINSKGGLYEALNPESMFGSVKAMAGLPQFDRNNVQQNITIDMGGIEMHGVNDVETFAENVVYSFQHNRKVRDVIMDGTFGIALGKGRLGIMKY